MKKNILSLLLILLIVFSLNSSFAVADSSVEASSANRELLTGLGIINSEDAALEGEVSRGDFVRLAIGLVRNHEVLLNDEPNRTVFSDVSDEDENYLCIAAAQKLMLISGNGDSTFRPEEPVESAAACKILLGVMGYSELAEASGGYPAGYFSLANRLELLKGVNTANGILLADDVFALIVNALDAKVLEMIAVEDGDFIYQSNGNTLLEYSFDITKTEGLVSANAYSDLYAQSSDIDENCLCIDGKVYKTQNDFSDLLGYNVDAYYKQDTNDLIFAQANEDNKEILVTAKEIQSASLEQIIYIKEGDTAENKARLSNRLNLIKNGKMAILSEENLIPVYGDILLIDNDGDNTYDVAKSRHYEIMQVSGVLAEDGKIIGTNSRELLVDPVENERDVRLVKSGKAIELMDLLPGDVISYAESEGAGRNITTIHVSDAVVSGVVDEIGDEFVTIDKVKYSALGGLVGNEALGKEVYYAVGLYNTVIYKKLDLSYVYGYLTDVAAKEFGKVTCRIFTENNRWVTLDFADKVRFNGESYDAATVCNTKLGTDPDNYRQLVRYRVNESGEVREINTANTYTAFSYEEEEAIQNDAFRKIADLTSAEYIPQVGAFDGKVSVSDSTIIFSIPDMKKDWELSDFDILPVSSLTDSQNYTGIAYDGDKLRYARACVLINASVSSMNTNNDIGKFVIFSRMTSLLNQNKEEKEAICGYMGGKIIKIPVKDQSVLSAYEAEPLAEGDVLQILYNKNGEITKVNRLFKIADYKTSIAGNLSSPSTFIAGEVKAADYGKNRFLIEYGNSETAVVGTDSGLKGVYIYYTDTGKSELGEVSDILQGDKIFGGFRYLQAREIIIIR